MFEIKEVKYPNGDRYEGEFLDNEMHGNGTLYCKDGSTQTGVWEEGKLK